MTYAASQARPLVVTSDGLLRGVMAFMLSIGSISIIEPSPYDALFLLLTPVALVAGLVLTRTLLVLALLTFVYLVAMLVALQPYLEHRPIAEGLTPTVYTILTIYMFATTCVFASIFARDTKSRITLALNAYAISCVIAGTWDILSYFDVGGLAAREPIPLRVAGPFKDPNVNGSYCVLGALYLMQQSFIGPARYRPMNFLGFLVALAGVFLSFSRGSWLAFIIASGLLVVSTYVTADDAAMRRKIARTVIVALAAVVVIGLIMMTNETMRETFILRFQLVQEYDLGNGGRFGNQLESISMLLERPFGFGPFRFPLFFDLNPHNSYVGAFSSAGWMGGLAFLLLALLSARMAWRLCFAPTPFLRQAQALCAAFICILLQAIQIDIDHWRFAFFMLGGVWGLESARVNLPRLSRRVTNEA